MLSPQRTARIRNVVAQRQRGLTVVLEDIHYPPNAAAVIRACDAFGVQNVHYIFEQEAGYAPNETGRISSSSANKWLDFHVHETSLACFRQLQAEGYQLIITVPPEDASEDIFDCRFDAPNIALVFGNEKTGVSETARRFADRRLTIPMRGMVGSLNISVTAGIFLYEITRQRQQSGQTFNLDHQTQTTLIADFTRRATKWLGRVKGD